MILSSVPKTTAADVAIFFVSEEGGRPGYDNRVGGGKHEGDTKAITCQQNI